MRIDSNLDLQELLDIAKDTLKDLDSGEKFMLKDLFRGFEWNRIPVNFRTRIGTVFMHMAQYECKDMIEILDKTPQNQQMYRKK